MFTIFTYLDMTEKKYLDKEAVERTFVFNNFTRIHCLFSSSFPSEVTPPFQSDISQNVTSLMSRDDRTFKPVINKLV